MKRRIIIPILCFLALHSYGQLPVSSVHSNDIDYSNPKEYTIAELANMVREKINPDVRIINETLPIDDPCRRKPDISLAQEILDWTPSINLEDGLEKTIEWFKNYKKQ